MWASLPADTSGSFRSEHYSRLAAFDLSGGSPNAVSKPNPTVIARRASFEVADRQQRRQLFTVCRKRLAGLVRIDRT
jgi:hypothetical protein